MRSQQLTLIIFIGMLLGIALGYTCHILWPDPQTAKAMIWFVSASLVSLLLGLIMVNILRPGDDLNLPLPDTSASTNLNVASLSLKDFVTHLVPRSAVEAMANNEILQIVVFSLFFGIAGAALGGRRG